MSPEPSLTKHVTVVEIDAELVDRSKMRFAEGGATNCAFVVADAYELPVLVPSPVDLVFLANTFHGLHDKPRLARAVCEVL